MAVWNHFFQLPTGKSLMEALVVLNDSLIQMHFSHMTLSFEILYCVKVQIQVNSLSSYLWVSFPLSCFIIERFRSRAQGQFAYILCSDQSLTLVVWLLSKARRMLWSSFESLRNVLLGKQRLWGSSQPQSLFSIIIIRGDSRPQIYNTAIHMCKMCTLERSQVGQKYSRETFYPGVEVPWDLLADSSTFTHMSRCTRRITLLSLLHFSLVR